MTNKPFIRNPQINKICESIDFLVEQYQLLGDAPSMLITGEAGCGKSEIAKRYVEKNPPVAEEERFHIPALHLELVSVGTQKDLYRSLLKAIKDPQNGEGGKNAKDLLERFCDLTVTVGLKVLFIDEIQVIMERRSHRVVSGLADSFKDLVKKVNAPVVFIGVPWSKYLIDANDQLGTRVSYRFVIEPFRISNKLNFKEFRMLLKLLAEHYGQDESFELSSPENAFRIFSFTSGFFRGVINLVSAAYTIANRTGSKFCKENFVEAIRIYGVPDNDNPFLVDLYDLQLEEYAKASDWSFTSKRGNSPIIDYQRNIFILNKDKGLELQKSA